MTRAYNTATTQQNSGGAVAGVTAGKNAVINGGMDIWQRGTSFTGTGAYYAADRMCFNAFTVSGRTVSRQSPGSTLPQFQYCTRVARNSGNTDTTNTAFGQSLETVDSLRFAGQTVTLSFWVRAGANLSGSITAYLISGTGTDQNRISGGYSGEAFPIGATFTPTTSWQRYSYTGTVASTATELSIYFQGGSSGTAGANDWYEITGIQLEAGSVATPFSRAQGTIQGELAACQRYYYRHNGVDEDYIVPIWCNSSTRANGFYWTPVLMRVSPTLETTGVAGNYKVVVNGVVTTCTSVPTKDNGSNNYFGAIVISFPASGFTNATAGTAVFETGPGASFVGFSAEL